MLCTERDPVLVAESQPAIHGKLVLGTGVCVRQAQGLRVGRSGRHSTSSPQYRQALFLVVDSRMTRQSNGRV